MKRPPVHDDQVRVFASMAMNSTPRELIRTYTEAFQAGNIEVIAQCFHDDAAIVGSQDGLFIATNRATFLRFWRDMGLAQANSKPRKIEPVWEEQHGNLACACVTESFSGSRILCYLTMIKTEGGWKFISRSFVGHEVEEPPASQTKQNR
jgi:ketosteroid isomerase-like protein